ncbi:MAG TPA: response regulator, partial [Longimicrobiales bacterium]
MDLERLTVLVVDDEPAVREVLRLRIEAWGPRVVQAGDVAEAERAMAATPPDVVVSDVVMPDASGLELLARLTRDNPGLPVILMTAHGSV